MDRDWLLGRPHGIWRNVTRFFLLCSLLVTVLPLVTSATGMVSGSGAPGGQLPPFTYFLLNGTPVLGFLLARGAAPVVKEWLA